MKIDNLPVDRKEIESLARKWKIRELAVFGSVLREDFTEESDIDLLVSFAPDARLGLFDLVALKEELEQLFGRKVDLVEKKGLTNPYRRKAILETAQIIYES